MASQWKELPAEGGTGIQSINGDTTAAQLIVGAGTVTVATVGGTTTVTGTGSSIKASGKATLVAGTVTVSNASVASGSIIQLTCGSVGGVPGLLSVGTVIASTSFVINSSSDTDTSIINWSFV